MNIKLSESEIKIIRIWGDSIMSGGHWGDGDVVFPDEGMLLQQIAELEKDETAGLSSRSIDIALIWAKKSHGTPEEDNLIAKLKEVAE